MKILIVALSVCLVSNMAASAQSTTKSSKEETQKIIFTCPMHPNEVNIKEGECSKCGMKLVKKSTLKYNPEVKGSQTKVKTEKVFICSMDSTTSDKPGKCPKCGMKMKESHTAVYSCPMHPSAIGKQGDKCPKCGMDLILKDEEKVEHNH